MRELKTETKIVVVEKLGITEKYKIEILKPVFEYLKTFTKDGKMITDKELTQISKEVGLE